MPKLNSSFKFGVVISFIIIFLIMFAVALVMFWIPVSAAEKPNSIMKQTTAENYLIAQVNPEHTFVSHSNCDEILDDLNHSKQTIAA